MAKKTKHVNQKNHDKLAKFRELEVFTNRQACQYQAVMSKQLAQLHEKRAPDVFSETSHIVCQDGSTFLVHDSLMKMISGWVFIFSEHFGSFKFHTEDVIIHRSWWEENVPL